MPTFHAIRSMFFGNAIGLQFKNGGVVQTLRWFSIKYGLLHDIPLEVAEEKIKRSTFLEADKKSWEATTCKETAFLLMLHWLSATAFGSVRRVPEIEILKVLAGYWADYIRPYMIMGGGYCFTREGATPSGNTLTADGNTLRHIYLARSFRLYIRSHKMQMGMDDCPCPLRKL